REAAGHMGSGVVEIVQHRRSPLEDLSTKSGVVTVGPLHAAPKGGPVKRALGSSFYRRIVDGAVEELHRWGYRAQLRLDSDLLNPDLVGDINGPARDGVLLLGEFTRDIRHFVEQCLHPLVLIDMIHSGSVDVVTSDNFAGIKASFEHLYG